MPALAYCCLSTNYRDCCDVFRIRSLVTETRDRQQQEKIETVLPGLAKKELELAKHNFKPLTDPIAKKNFKDLANGFFKLKELLVLLLLIPIICDSIR